MKECGIDHILEAEKNGEISEANVLYLIENLNGAGTEDLTTDLVCHSTMAHSANYAQNGNTL